MKLKNGKSLALAGVMVLSLMGCGGGSDSGGQAPTRELLTGGSSKVWRASLISANAGYIGGDSDTEGFGECPLSYSPRGSGPDWACSASDTITFNESGQVTYSIGATPGTGTWSLSGSTLSIQFGGSLGTVRDQIEVRNSGRIVLQRIDRTVGSTVQTTEAENAYVVVSP
jgi:hypothetical protein